MRSNSSNRKSVILYHRAYRKLPGSASFFFIQFILLAFPLAAITFYYYPDITRIACIIAEFVLKSHFASESVQIVTSQFVDRLGLISYIDLPNKFPTLYFTLANAIVSLILLIYLVRVCNAEPLFIFLIIVLVVHLCAAVFFLAVPTRFPYTMADYSYLYMVQQISIWFFVPLIVGVAVLPLPASSAIKAVTLIGTCLYSLMFGVVRYAVFLFVLAKASLIYMAVLFFAFGPLIDFVYIVGIYGIYVNRLAIKIKGDFTLWRW